MRGLLHQMIERMQHATFPAVQRRRRSKSKAWKGVRARPCTSTAVSPLPLSPVGHIRLQDHRTVQFIQFPEQRGELASGAWPLSSPIACTALQRPKRLMKSLRASAKGTRKGSCVESGSDRPVRPAVNSQVSQALHYCICMHGHLPGPRSTPPCPQNLLLP